MAEECADRIGWEDFGFDWTWSIGNSLRSGELCDINIESEKKI
jgi:hypothetical protein